MSEENSGGAGPNLSTMDRVAIELAFFFGVGRLKKAPGTFGSIPGLAVGALIHRGALASGLPLLDRSLLVGCALLFLGLVSYWAIAQTEKALQIHDDQRIVIDEVLGQAIAVAFLQPSVWSLILAFGLFRLLDITKPGPIGWCDRELPGALGTMMDDVLAGLVAGALLYGTLLWV
jgi:phosphatidylglycerophosphatase A